MLLIHLSSFVVASTISVSLLSNISEYLNPSEFLVSALNVREIKASSLPINSYNFEDLFIYSSSFGLTLPSSQTTSSAQVFKDFILWSNFSKSFLNSSLSNEGYISFKLQFNSILSLLNKYYNTTIHY